MTDKPHDERVDERGAEGGAGREDEEPKGGDPEAGEIDTDETEVPTAD